MIEQGYPVWRAMHRKKAKINASKQKRVKKTDYMIDCLHLPKDVVKGMEIIQLMGNCEMEVRHFRALLSYDSCQIRIKAGRHRIAVQGECLKLDYFTAEEVRITGCIRGILFEEEDG